MAPCLFCLPPHLCCFSEDTLVTVKRKGVKKISLVRPGDELLTSSGKGYGKMRWTRFYAYAHKDDTLQTDFILLTFATGKELKVTEEHLVYICNQEGRKTAIHASKVQEGDEMYYLDSMTAIVSRDRVIETRQIRQVGVYSPLTYSGDFLANGFLVTCYAVVDNFKVAHAAFAPIRTWCRIAGIGNGKKCSSIHEQDGGGIHAYAKALMKLWEILPRSIVDRSTSYITTV